MTEASKEIYGNDRQHGYFRTQIESRPRIEALGTKYAIPLYKVKGLENSHCSYILYLLIDYN